MGEAWTTQNFGANPTGMCHDCDRLTAGRCARHQNFGTVSASTPVPSGGPTPGPTEQEARGWARRGPQWAEGEIVHNALLDTHGEPVMRERAYVVAATLLRRIRPNAETPLATKYAPPSSELVPGDTGLRERAETNAAAWALKAENQRLQDCLDAVAALHRPWYEVNGKRYDHVVYSDQPFEDHVCRTDSDACDPDNGEHWVLACHECRGITDDDVPGYSLWPCPTTAALAETGERDG